MLVSHRTPAPQRPRVVGEEILLGKSTRLELFPFKRKQLSLMPLAAAPPAQAPLGLALVSVRGCWEIEDWPEDALRALLTQAYGPSEAALQPLVKAVRDATYFLPRNPLQAARVLQGLPEPLADADPRLIQAERLLKAGADPRSLATAMRREGLNLRSAPAWSDRLALCDKGVVLGHGTVIVDLADHPDGSTGLAVEGNEANILALLSVASGRLVSPDALEKLTSASRSLAKGNVAQAAIALCHIGQPPLEDQDLAKMLTVAASCLDRGTHPFDLLKRVRLLTENAIPGAWQRYAKYAVDQPRDNRGRWTDGSSGSVSGRIQVADNRPVGTVSDAVNDPQITAGGWRSMEKPTNRIGNDDFEAMRSALARRSDLTDAQKYNILSLYAWEGGLMDNGNGVIAGLTRTFLRSIDEKAPKTAADTIDLYLQYMDESMETVGGRGVIDKINDPAAGAAFVDTIFYQGRGEGTRLIQQAINNVRRQSSQAEIDDDGKMGPGTLAAYQELVNSPVTRVKLLQALADQRRQWSAEQDDEHDQAKDKEPNPSDVIRFNWFR